MAVHTGELGPANGVPNFHRLVKPGGSQAASLRIPSQRSNSSAILTVASSARVRLDDMDLRTAPRVFDDTNRSILRAGGQIGSVRTPRHRPDRAAVWGERE